MTTVETKLTLNGKAVAGSAPSAHTLLHWLRDNAQAYEVKEGCGEGVCGACTVLVDGRSVTSCTVLAVQFDGADIETAASLAEDGEMNQLQRCFWETGAAQCGYCTAGMLMTSTELVRSGSRPSREEIREYLHGNLCRCTGYQAVVDAVEMATREPEGTK